MKETYWFTPYLYIRVSIVKYHGVMQTVNITSVISKLVMGRHKVVLRVSIEVLDIKREMRMGCYF